MLSRNRTEVQPRCSLPNELWAKVWGLLTPRDCIAVSHVSRDWRDMALQCPELWRSPSFISTVHHKDCSCRACKDRTVARPCAECGRVPVPQPGPALESAAAFIARSGGLPLELFVAVRSETADPAGLLAFAELIEPHKARLHTIRACVEDINAFQQFLQSFDELPYLRVLEVSSNWHDGLELDIERELRLPALEELSLVGQITIGDRFLVQCPEVLHLRVMFCSSDHLRTFLQAFPKVRSMVLRVGSSAVDVGSDELLAQVRQLLQDRPLDCIKISECFRVDVNGLAAIFQDRRPRSFSIDMVGKKELIADDFAMFKDITTASALSITAIPNSSRAAFSLSSIVSAGELAMNRTLNFEKAQTWPSGLWDAMKPITTTLHTLCIDSAFWSDVFNPEYLPRLPFVTEVTIVFSDCELRLPDWLTEITTENAVTRIWGHVQDVYLQATPEKPISLEMSDVEPLRCLFGLQPNVLLQSLTLEGLAVEADVLALLRSQVAHEIVLRNVEHAKEDL